MVELSCGKGAVAKLGTSDSRSSEAPIPVISTGSLGLDAALGVGGLPRGRIVEIYGPESSGKTTLALSVIAAAQAEGGVATFVDAEHALDVGYASALGVDTAELYVSQPDSGEQALEIVDTLAQSGAMDVIVVDSVAALVPRAELEGEMGDVHMGLQARLMSQALRKLTATLANSDTLLVFINQLRHKIGVIFGSPEVTAGGVGLKYYSSVRLDIRRTGSIKLGGEIVGNATRVKVVKNKVAAPFKEVHFDIEFGKGIARLGEIVDLGVEHGIISRAGSWYTYLPPVVQPTGEGGLEQDGLEQDGLEEDGVEEDGLEEGGMDGEEERKPGLVEGEGNQGQLEPVKLGQGRENVKVYLENNPDLADEIYQAIRQELV